MTRVSGCRLAGALGVLLWIGIVATALASSPRPLRVDDGAPPAFSVYTSRDGLGDEIWSTVGVDADGFVWAGSASSLARFDGYRWTAVALSGATSLVRDMALDDGGTLWAIFEREGLARYDGHAWHLQGEARYFQRFSQPRGSNGGRQLWVADEKGLLRLQDGTWQYDPGNDATRTGRPIAIARTRALAGEAREWMGTSASGLWYRPSSSATPAPWRRFDHPGVNNMLVSDVIATVDGDDEELWVASYGGGLVRIRDDGIRVWRADTGELPSEALYSLAETRTAAGARLIWIASRVGLLRVRGDRIDVFDRRHGLPSDAVRAVKVQRGRDGSDLLWLATEGGLVRATLTDSPWQTVSLLGARENGVFGVLLEPDGSGGERLWLGTAKEGLGLLQDGQWRQFTHTGAGAPLRNVRGIWRLPTADGGYRRLFGASDAGLFEIDDDLNIVPIETPWPRHPEEIATSAMSRTHDGRIEWWFATVRSGIWRYRDGVWTGFVADGATMPWYVLNIAEQIDAAGRSWLWAVGPQGLTRFDGERWTMLRDVPGLPTDGFRSATPFSDRNPQELWLGSNRLGVIRLDVGDPLHPHTIVDDRVPPAPDPTTYSVLRDSRDRLYICTNNGIQQLTPRAGGGYDQRVFRRRDGLVHDECNTGSQRIDDTDRYWVGTLGGLSVFDPDAQTIALPTTPAPLHVTALRVDGVSLPVPETAPLALALAAGVRELQVEYTLLTGTRENESTYRTQLLGFDPEPTRWTSERARGFSGLPPGSYVLQIEARDFSGGASAHADIEFSIAPHWWQRPLLQVLLVGIAITLAFLAVMTYNRGLRKRQRELRREVGERTSELRSANERLTELSYLDPLTGVANRRRLTEVMASSIARASAQQLPIGLIVADVDNFKDYNDRYGHLAGDVALRAIAQALQSAARAQDLVARFGGEEFACLMIDADRTTVSRVAERMRALVEALPPRSLGNDSQTVTLSAGMLHCIPGPIDRPEELLGAADAALYLAKKSGRNRVIEVDA